MNLKTWELEIFFFLLVPEESWVFANKDNKVDFSEFVVMVAALTVACNDCFVEQLKKKWKTSSKII